MWKVKLMTPELGFHFFKSLFLVHHSCAKQSWCLEPLGSWVSTPVERQGGRHGQRRGSDLSCGGKWDLDLK